MKWCCWLMGIIWVAAAVSGCGGGSAKQMISGNVELDGQPLTEGTIIFEPKDREKGLYPEEAQIRDGSYSVHIMPGECLVRVHAMKKVPLGPGEPSVSGEKDKLVSMIHPDYNLRTTLTASVSPSATKHDFQVKSEKK